MATIVSTSPTGIRVEDQATFEKFLSAKGVTHYELFPIQDGSYLGIGFTVGGEMMKYKLRGLEHEFMKTYFSQWYDFEAEWDKIMPEVFGEIDDYE